MSRSIHVPKIHILYKFLSTVIHTYVLHVYGVSCDMYNKTNFVKVLKFWYMNIIMYLTINSSGAQFHFGAEEITAASTKFTLKIQCFLQISPFQIKSKFQSSCHLWSWRGVKCIFHNVHLVKLWGCIFNASLGKLEYAFLMHIEFSYHGEVDFLVKLLYALVYMCIWGKGSKLLYALFVCAYLGMGICIINTYWGEFY